MVYYSIITRNCRLAIVAGSCYLLVGIGRAAAQATESRNPATDTLQPSNPKHYVPVSQLCTASGKRFFVFILEGGEQPAGLEFTWRHPMSTPRPRPVRIAYQQLRWVRCQGKTYVPLALPKHQAQGLVHQRLAGSRAELFDIAWRKQKVVEALPLVGVVALLTAREDSTAYTHHYWFLRRPGEAAMAAVPEGKKFAPFLANYLADAPELAAAVRAGAEGHRYADVPQLLARYNALPAATGATK